MLAEVKVAVRRSRISRDPSEIARA